MAEDGSTTHAADLTSAGSDYPPASCLFREHVNHDLRQARLALEVVRVPATGRGECMAAAAAVGTALGSARGWLDLAERDVVRSLRAQGASWQQVGDAWNVTGQAAQQRWGSTTWAGLQAARATPAPDNRPGPERDPAGRVAPSGDAGRHESPG